jgi:signal transduction protein with GAF and PtsI domain
VRSAYASSPELLARLRSTRIELDSTLVGRAAREGHPIAVPNLDLVDLDPHLQVLYDDGWRSVLAVPVLRDGRIIGALVVRRRTPGEFPEETLEFLETFASQSADGGRQRPALPRAAAEERRAAGDEPAQV